MEFRTTLSTVASIFLLLMFGYFAKRLGALKSDDAGVVNALLINLAMPALIFTATRSKDLSPEMFGLLGAALAAEIIILGLAYLASKALRLNDKTASAFLLVSAFGNTGFLGYPVVDAAFAGDKAAMLMAVMYDQFAMALPLCVIGVAIVSAMSGNSFKIQSSMSFLKTPLLPATVISLLLRNVDPPDFILKSLQYLAAGTVPLAMISIGLNLSAGEVAKRPLGIIAAVFFKMMLLPTLVAAFTGMLNAEGIERQIVVIESAMPSAVFTGVVAAKFGGDGRFAAGAIFVSTLFSIVWLPLVLSYIA